MGAPINNYDPEIERYTHGIVGTDVKLYVRFEDEDGARIPTAACNITIRRSDKGSAVVANAAAVEIGTGYYRYTFAPTVAGSYVGEWHGVDEDGGDHRKQFAIKIFDKVGASLNFDPGDVGDDEVQILGSHRIPGVFAVDEDSEPGDLVAITAALVATTYATRAAAGPVAASAIVLEKLSATTARLADFCTLDGLSGLTVGPLYVGVDGALSGTRSTTEGELDQCVGYALSDTRAELWTVDHGELVASTDAPTVAADLADHIADADDPHEAAGYAAATQAAQDAADAAQGMADAAGAAATQVANDLADHAADMDLHGGGGGGADETTADMHIWVDAVDGDDDENDGLTEDTPVATIAAALGLIPQGVKHLVQGHLAAGTYEIARSYLFRTRNVSGEGRVHFFADDVWDPGVFVDRVTGVAAAGTNSNVIKTTGLTLNAQRGYTIEMTSGDAMGERRTIRNNTATDVVPSIAFGAVEGAVPAPGDTFRIFENAVVIAPQGVGAFEVTQHSTFGDGYSDDVQSKYTLTGITFPSLGAVYRGGYVVGSSTQLYGVLFQDSLRIEYAKLRASDATHYVTTDAKLGWGCTCTGDFVYTIEGGKIEGVFVITGGFAGSGWIPGGFINGAYHSSDQDLNSMSYSGYWGNVSLLMGSPLTVYPGHRIWVYYVDFVAGISDPLLNVIGGEIMMSGINNGESTGATTVKVRSGGRVHCLSAPTLGKASGGDYDNGSGSPVNKSFFSGADTRHYFQGALIERSS